MKLDKIANSKNDEFYTPNYAIYPILKYLDNKKNIWCPFDTEKSNFVKILKENNKNVIYTHIEQNQDFFSIEKPANIDAIISNPPYSKKNEVLKKCFDLKIPFALLIGIAGIFESKERFNLFKNNNFEVMYFNKRISYFKNYEDQKPSLNPPFSSAYFCQNILPEKIIFEIIN
jgi:hypothetical protein